MLPVKDIVKKYLGEEYQFGGRGSGGMDCYGLVLSIYKDLGISLPELRVEDERWHVRDKPIDIADLSNSFDSVKLLKTFDLVAFINSKGIVNHAGVYVGGGQFIHATRKAGVCISHLSDRMWQERYAGGYRHKGLK